MPKEKLIFLLTIISLLYFAYAIIRSPSPKTYLLCVVYLLPFMNFLATKEAMGGFKVYDVITFISLLYLARYFFADNFIDKKYLHLILFIFLMMVAVAGSLLSEQSSKSLLEVVKILPPFIFGRFLLLECIQDPAFHYKIIKALRLSLTVALVFLGLQFIIGLGFTFYPTLNDNTFDPLRGAIRYPGYFNDSQAQGQFFAIGSFLFLYNPADMPKKAKLTNYILFVLAMVAILLSGSRSAFLGFLVGLFVIFVLTAKRYTIYVILAGFFAFIAYTYLPSKSGVLSRTENIDEDLKFRQSVWKDAFDISKKYPLFGIGSGNYQSYIKRHLPNQYFEIDHEIVYFDQPENGYLKVIVELGYIGFAIFILILLSPPLRAIKSYLTGESDYKAILLAASLLGWMVAFNSVYSLFDIRLMIMVATVLVLILSFPKNIPVQSVED